jgi:hypothetical protein
MKKSIFLYICLLFVSIKTYDGIKIFTETFLEYSKINEILNTKINLNNCFKQKIDFKIQMLSIYFKKKNKDKVKNLVVEILGQSFMCLMELSSLFKLVKQIGFDDPIVIGIRLLGILDEIEMDIINEYHNEDSDYFSLAKTSGIIFNKIFQILKKTEETKNK